MNLSDWQINNQHFVTITARLVKMQIGEFPLNAQQISEILEKSI